MNYLYAVLTVLVGIQYFILMFYGYDVFLDKHRKLWERALGILPTVVTFFLLFAALIFVLAVGYGGLL